MNPTAINPNQSSNTQSPDVAQLLPLIMQTGLLNIPPPMLQMMLQQKAPQPGILGKISGRMVKQADDAQMIRTPVPLTGGIRG